MPASAATSARADRPDRDLTSARHRWLAAFLAFHAAAAVGGAVSLAIGAIDLGSALNARLPFASPVLGGLALLAFVAVPLGLTAGSAWRGEAETADLLVGTGLLLVGWIVVQLAFIRSFSWFHPAYAGIGTGLVLVGERLHRFDQHTPPGRRRSVAVSAMRCAIAVVGLVARHRLRHPPEHVGSAVTLPDGRAFRVFRETVRLPDRAPTDPVVLAVWFHLRGVPAGSSRRRRLFERLCVLNTVLFAGSTGFLRKRWLVDDATADWAGLYTWDTVDAADRYGRYITTVLRPLSTVGSVGYEVRPDDDLVRTA